MQSLDQKFNELHAAKPEIYQAFKEVVFDLIRRGFTHFSADGAFHIVRYTKGVSMDSTYRVNNNYVSRYARMFANEYKQYKDFFQFKQLKAA